MSYYTEKQFTKEGKDTAETSVLFQTYFSDVKGQILEAGCSVGSFLSLNPKQIQGIDFDEESVKICRQKGFNRQKLNKGAWQWLGSKRWGRRCKGKPG